MPSDDRYDHLRAALARRYLLERELAQGGMATVFLAVDQKHDRKVAIKVLRPDVAGEHGVDRFLREIRVTAGLSHPHILPLLDSGEVGGLPFFVMPYVEGESLRERLEREGQMPIEDALRVAMEVADALATAHRHGVIHRDLKPANILLEEGHAVVADFGIGRAIASAGGEFVTTSGIAVGTPAYLSPEQAGGEGEVDGRSDLYGLGCLLYEMLSGEPPFTGASPQALVAKHLGLPVPRVSLLRSTVPDDLEAVVEKALAKSPADRYQTAEEFGSALRDVTEEILVTGARRRAGAAVLRRARRRWRLIALALPVLALAAVAVGMSWSAIFSEPLDPNRIVVFPVRSSGPAAPSAATVDVGTVVGYAFEGTDPLRWIDGSDHLSPEELSDPERLSGRRKRGIARELGAGFFVDGSVVGGLDSLSVILRLHDVEGDSVVVQGGASAALADGQVGPLSLVAVRQLLPALLGTVPTHRLDMLSQRDPAAVANWLQGERAYRQSRMEEALEHFQRALDGDPLMAPAALGAAQAAAWKAQIPAAQGYIRAARGLESSLPRPRADFAVALDHYLYGRADSALVSVQKILLGDPTSPDAWMLLGMAANHLLPSRGVVERTASRVMSAMMAEDPQRAPPALQEMEVALRRGSIWTGADIEEAVLETAVVLDPGFTPPMVHLAELALARGDTPRAHVLIDSWRAVEPDSAVLQRVSLEIRCVRDGPGSLDWEELGESAPLVVLQVGLVLARGMSRPECANRAFTAVLESPTASVSERWGGLLGQQSLLFAEARWAELRTLLDSPEAAVFGGPNLYLMDTAAGAPTADRASEVASLQTRPLAETPSPSLWLQGVWASHVSDSLTLADIGEVLRRRVEAGGSRVDSLLARITEARITVASAEPTRAITSLSALIPGASRDGLTWQPWEALAAERVLLASLLLEAGRYAESISVASQIDNTEPIVHLVYLPSSLSVRAAAADSMGDPGLAEHFRTRLASFRPDPGAASR